MSTRTKYIIQGLFFFLLSVFCLYAYMTGKSASVKNFTFAGIFFSLFIGIIYLKNGLKKK
ncbi:MAG: hypothetical protein IKS99_04360 [Firmicutes bacterium]|nr:hypothetical protein [Bacillota bacterium]